MTPFRRCACSAAVLVLLAGAACWAEPSSTGGGGGGAVQAIAPPRNPIPPEEKTTGITKFSFIVYGDTRGARDGVELQYMHSLVVDAILKKMKAMSGGDEAVRFVFQTGDAVVDGLDPKQWNVSFVSLIDRITTEGGVPYFLAPGNHDVTGAPDLDSPGRKKGLDNYLSAVGRLIPPDGASRRLSGYPTYAVGYGNVFAISFDSNIAGDETQFDWIKGQLEGLDRKRYTVVVAVFHHPVFSSGPHGGAKVESQSRILREKYMPLFRRHQVRLLFAGHDHLFEHWVETYKDESGAGRRIDEIVTGGGGAPAYPYSGEPDVDAYEKAGADRSVKLRHLVRPGPDAGDNPPHFVVVHVDGERIRLEVVGVDYGRDFKPYRSSATSLDD